MTVECLHVPVARAPLAGLLQNNGPMPRPELRPMPRKLLFCSAGEQAQLWEGLMHTGALL